MNSKVAVIGGGISGISAARLLCDKTDVVVYEREARVGGLIRCEELGGGLYHKLGGHVFNTKIKHVDRWFWNHFDRDKEFFHVKRNAKILLDGTEIGYPIENHIFQLPKETVNAVVQDLLSLEKEQGFDHPSNLRDFLMGSFGRTLCDLYFFPYNEKLWRTDLSEIPLEWLEGKLPMPPISDIFSSNILRQSEMAFVHSYFYYPREGGSQFVIDRLALDLDIRYGKDIQRIERSATGWEIDGEHFDWVVYTGDIRNLYRLAPIFSLNTNAKRLAKLRARGITNVFCECDLTDTSWLYLPGKEFSANRIIYTGAFSANNNYGSRMTCVVEFLYGTDEKVIEQDLKRLPGNLVVLAKNDVPAAYVIQEPDTRSTIQLLKAECANEKLYLVGRFAEWEYHNVDKAIESAMSVTDQILSLVETQP